MFWVEPPSVIAVGVLLPLLAAAAVTLRFHGRRANGVGFGIDDWLVLTSLILCIGCGITLVVGAALNGLAQPTPQGPDFVDGLPGYFFVESEALSISWKCQWAFNLMQMLAFGTVKLSIIFLYRRIFRGTLFDICSFVMIGLVTVWTVGFFLTVLFQCGQNFWALWSNLFDYLTYCVNDTVYLEVNCISDIITDVLILVIPIPMIWNIQLSTARRIGLCAIFFTGSLAVLAGIARLVIYLVFLSDAYSQSQGIMLITTYLYWSLIELSLSITAACLPTLRPLLARLPVQRLGSSLQSLFSRRTSGAYASKTSPRRSRRSRSRTARTDDSQETFNVAAPGRGWMDKGSGLPDGAERVDMRTSITALPDLEAGRSSRDLPRDGIVVEKDVSRRSSAV